MAGKKGVAKGGEFEERLLSYFLQTGFFAVRGLPFKFDADDISDIDIWLYERPNAIFRRRTIVDARSRQRPKAVERILWLKGLQQGLNIESAIVATPDRRPSIRRLAASLGVSLLDGDAIDRFLESKLLGKSQRLPFEYILDLLRQQSSAHDFKDWKAKVDSCKASLAIGLGFPSANLSLETAKLFLAAALRRPSERRESLARLFLICLSYVAISLDYALNDLVFMQPAERQKHIDLGLRFGEERSGSTLDAVKLALGLVRQFAPNGNAIARQVEAKFYEEAALIPVDIVAEHAARVANSDALFRTAQDLDALGYNAQVSVFDDLQLETKSLIGVAFDYADISRTQVDQLFPKKASAEFKGSMQSSLPLETKN
jgi:hypothetical protein